MDFSFTDEQKQLADAVRRFVDKDYGFEARNKIVYSPERCRCRKRKAVSTAVRWTCWW